MVKEAGWMERAWSFGGALVRDVFNNASDVPQDGMPWFPNMTRQLSPPAQSEPSYISDYGPRILQIDRRTGVMEIEFRLYVPSTCSEHVQIRGPFTYWRWRDMEPVIDDLFSYVARRVRPGTWYEFRVRDAAGQWQVITDPMAYRFSKRFDPKTQTFNHYALTPMLAEDMPVRRPAWTQALSVFEGTLPGLLGRWQAGRYFPQQPDRHSFAERVMASGLIPYLRSRHYNALMVPIQASVANLLDYNWKYSYLVSGLGAIDPELGDWHELKRLVSALHGAGVTFIPDLVFVHQVRNVSPRAIENLRHGDGRSVWFDGAAYKHRDFHTWMHNLEDRQIRLHLVEILVRFIQELDLAAYRFDFVDGLIMQYRDRPVNYGEVLLDELLESLDVHGCRATCISEAFATRGHPVVRQLADVLYQPWVGCVTLDATLRAQAADGMPDLTKTIDGLENATRQAPYRPILTYTVSHDEAARDKQVMRDRKLDSGETVSAGGHLAQLVVDFAEKHLVPHRLAPSELLEYVATHVLLVESLSMFSGNFAHLSHGGFGDLLKLGAYDDPDGWKTVWDAATHPDLAPWSAKTGLSHDEVAQRIAKHQKQMSALREMYLKFTPVDAARRRPLVQIDYLGRHPELPALAFARSRRTHPGEALLLAFNFGLTPVQSLTVPLPAHLGGAWTKLWFHPNDEYSCRLSRPCYLAGRRNGEVQILLPAHSMLILRRVESDVARDARTYRGVAGI